jgi:hypothetical protein
MTAQLLCALACAVLGLRAMIGAIVLARTPAPAPAPAAERPALVELAGELMDPPEERAAAEEPAAANDDAAGTPLRLTLSVMAGPERSEIYVNGARLGLSPYLGDFTCKQGEALRIEVVPRAEALIERQAKCVGKNVFIRD